MQSTFNLRRFGLLLRYDLHRCHPRYGEVGRTIISGIMFPTLMVLVQLLMRGELYEGSAMVVYRLCLAVGYPIGMAVIQHFQLYPQVAKPGKGIYFALLPASKSEKYLSMLLMTLVVMPAITILGALALDTLLALFHVGPWQEFFWQHEVDWTINPWIAANIAVAAALPAVVAIWINTIRSKWITLLAFLAWLLWLVVSVASMVALLRWHTNKFDTLLGIAFGIQLLALVAAIVFGRRRMDRMTY